MKGWTFDPVSLQATLFDPQLHDGSCVCERVASIVDGEQSEWIRAGCGHKEQKNKAESSSQFGVEDWVYLSP